MASPLATLTRTDSHSVPLADDEEEETVYLSLELGAVDPNLLPHCASMRLVGLETPTPFLQLGDSVFRGLHVSTLGTELVFDDASPDGTTRSIRSFAHIEYKVLFSPVTLIPKSNPAAEPGAESAPSPRDPETPDPPASGSGSVPRQPTVARRADHSQILAFDTYMAYS
ncbi:transcription factor TFIIIC subunit [Ceratobasidium sp. AG-Ba]|nr:transcription factor TFIIIC subunit [Ceratobasidium sp. AG-Ba]